LWTKQILVVLLRPLLQQHLAILAPVGVLAVLGYAVGTYGPMFVVYYYTKYLKLSLK
jgi:hypothetical protein